MAKSLPYRRASGEPAAPHRAFVLRRWLLAPLFIAATVGMVFLVAGDQAGAVFQTWVPAIFLLPVLVAGLMLGVAMTGPFARRGVFENSPYPDLLRVVVSLALGLGALALGMLLLGTVHLIEPGHVISGSPEGVGGGGGAPLPTGGYPWVPGFLLCVAGLIGFVPSRTFLRSFTRLPFKKAIQPAEYLILLAAVPVAMLLVAATYPPGSLWLTEGHGYDVLEYHLQLPREYALHNSTAPLSHNVYSYFPQNVEMLYLLTTQLAKFAMTEGGAAAAPNGYLWGIYPSQFLHVILMLTAAAAIGLTPIRLSAAARFLAVVLFLSIPWTIITGSLAYNEGGMMLFGSLALSVALSPAQESGEGRSRFAGPVLVGILLGLSLGCKMTAGVFFAVPVAVVMVLGGFARRDGAGGGTRLNAVGKIGVAAVLAALVYSPWAIRAAVYSGGNPVFPIGTSILPRANWTAEQSERFIEGHSAKQDNHLVGALDVSTRAAALFRESVMSAEWSPGYASIYKWANEKPDDAWYKQIGILWVIALPAVLLAFLAALRQKTPGALTQVIALSAMLVLQVLAWMFLTHTQSRFLLPCAIPLALLVAQGSQGLGANVGGLPLGVLRIFIVTVIAFQALCSAFLLLPEADLLLGTHARGDLPPRRQPIGMLFEFSLRNNWAAQAEDPSAEKSMIGERPIGKILLLGGITPLFDEGDIEYNTVFDRNELADVLKSRGPKGAAEWLRAQHFNYVLIDWGEIERLRKSYGYDEAITMDSIKGLVDQGIVAVPLPALPFYRGKTLLQVSPTTTKPR